MWCRTEGVEHRAGDRGVHVEPRMPSVGVVEHHVDNYGHAALVALVDKLAVVVGCAVGLVGGEVEVRIVAPRLVAGEFHHRHQLHGIYAESLDIVEFVDGLPDGAVPLFLSFGAGEVAHKQFVDNKVGWSHALEVRHLPVKFVGIGIIYGKRDVALLYGRAVDQTRWIYRHVGEHGCGDGLVVVGIEHQFCPRVAHFHLMVHQIVVDFVRAVGHIADGGPEVAHAVGCVGVVHMLFGHNFVVVPRSAEHDALLAGRKHAECGRAVGIGGDTRHGVAAREVRLDGLREIFGKKRQGNVAAHSGFAFGGNACGMEHESEFLDGLACGNTIELTDVGDGDGPEILAGIGHAEFFLGSIPVRGAVAPVGVGF